MCMMTMVIISSVYQFKRGKAGHPAQLVEDAIRVLKRKNGTASKQMPDLRIFFVSTAALPVVTAAMFSVSSVFSQYPVIRTVLIAATAYTSMK